MILCDTLNPGFLQESQTFVGVLISILVLCILIEGKDQSNILKRLIEYAIKRREGKIEETVKLYSGHVPLSSIKNTKRGTKSKKERDSSLNRICLNHYLKESGNQSPEGTEKIYEEGVDLQAKISLETFDILLLGSEDEKEIKGFTSKVKDSSIPGMASFFCILFGLLMYVCDELLILWGDTIWNVVFSLITGMTYISYAYWIIIWTRYIRNNRISNLGLGHHDSTPGINGYNDNINTFLGRLSSTRMLLIIAIVFFVLAYVLSVFISSPTLKKWVVFGGGIALPFLLIALLMIWRTDKGYPESHENILRHFGYFIMLCLLWSSAILVSDKYTCIQGISMDYSQTFENIIRFLAESFLLLNGLIAAYYIPIKLVKRIPADLIHYAEGKADPFLKERERLDAEISKFVDKLYKEGLLK